jgi:hypothetical protein
LRKLATPISGRWLRSRRRSRRMFSRRPIARPVP